MMPPDDETSPPRDPLASSAESAGGDAATNAAAPQTFARWYRASTREPADRARHLEAIAEAMAARRAGARVPGALMRNDRRTGAADAALLSPRPDVATARETTPSSDASAFSDRSHRTRPLSLQHDGAEPRRSRAGVVIGRVSRSPWVRAAALVVFAAGGIALLASGHRDPTGSAQVPPTRDVGFALRLPDAAVRQVSLAGDFNGWDASALPMVRDPADGTWRVRVPLAPGRHTYSYVIDGARWVIDPLAPRTVEGALGPANVIAVMGDT